MINENDINDKIFLDENGEVYRSFSPAGPGEYFWWCRNVESDQEKEFTSKHVIERIASYYDDIKYFKNKENTEIKTFNFIKNLSSKVLRKEILKNEEWSNEDVDILNDLKNGNFNIECE